MIGDVVDERCVKVGRKPHFGCARFAVQHAPKRERARVWADLEFYTEYALSCDEVFDEDGGAGGRVNLVRLFSFGRPGTLRAQPLGDFVEPLRVESSDAGLEIELVSAEQRAHDRLGKVLRIDASTGGASAAFSCSFAESECVACPGSVRSSAVREDEVGAAFLRVLPLVRGRCAHVDCLPLIHSASVPPVARYDWPE